MGRVFAAPKAKTIDCLAQPVLISSPSGVVRPEVRSDFLSLSCPQSSAPDRRRYPIPYGPASPSIEVFVKLISDRAHSAALATRHPRGVFVGRCAGVIEMERQHRAGVTSVALGAAVRGYKLLVSPLLPPACRFFLSLLRMGLRKQSSGTGPGAALFSPRGGWPAAILGAAAATILFPSPAAWTASVPARADRPASPGPSLQPPRNGTTQSPHRDRALGRDPDRFSVRVRAHAAATTLRPVGGTAPRRHQRRRVRASQSAAALSRRLRPTPRARAAPEVAPGAAPAHAVETREAALAEQPRVKIDDAAAARLDRPVRERGSMI